MVEIRALAATGMLGTGFRAASLAQGLRQRPCFIGCDAGSTDAGPYYLGSGRTKSSPDATRRDLRLMLEGARAYRIPLLIGSGGYGGARRHVAEVRELIVGLAAEAGLHFRLAVIESEMEPAKLREFLDQGRLRPLGPAGGPGHLDHTAIDRSTRMVAVMGAEPFQAALQSGADVVLAGRASDAAVYAAYPLRAGIPEGVAWHAAKILECGAASVEHRPYPDCMFAWLHEDSFTIEPPNESLRATPQSVLAHTLYENPDPFRLLEPGGCVDTSQAAYEAWGARGVMVRGSRFEHHDRYTVKVEAAARVGYRAFTFGGIADPLILRSLDAFLDGVTTTIAEKTEASLGLVMGRDFSLRYLRYGLDGVPGTAAGRAVEGGPPTAPREVGLVIDVIAGDREHALAIITVAYHTALHYQVPAWTGLTSNIAFPFSPPYFDGGEVFEFTSNCVAELTSPLELFPMELLDV